MIPDFGGIFWMAMTLLVAIVAIVLFLLFYFWVMPPIARRMIRAKWSRGSIAFIQHAGRVRLCINKAELPEGVVENEFGWFMRSTPPYREGDQKRGPGRPHKDSASLEGASDKIVTDCLDVALRLPILDGLGKQVLFGSTDTSLLSNLDVLGALSPNKTKTKDGIFSHAILNILKEVIPATFGRTNLDALAQFNYLRGLKVRGGELTRVVIIALAVIGVIVSAGLVFWFLTQK